MITRGNSTRRLHELGLAASLSLAVVGYATAHTLTYWLLSLDPSGKSGHLHDYLRAAELLGVVSSLVVFAVALVLGRQLLQAAGVDRSGRGLLCSRMLHAIVPVVVFVCAEYAERLVAGEPGGPALLMLAVGVALQAAVGWLLTTAGPGLVAIALHLRGHEPVLQVALSEGCRDSVNECLAAVEANSGRYDRGPPVPRV